VSEGSSWLFERERERVYIYHDIYNYINIIPSILCLCQLQVRERERESARERAQERETERESARKRERQRERERDRERDLFVRSELAKFSNL
jgi:hypothetical protein